MSDLCHKNILVTSREKTMDNIASPKPLWLSRSDTCKSRMVLIGALVACYIELRVNADRADPARGNEPVRGKTESATVAADGI
jgi:hypothetical protein